MERCIIDGKVEEKRRRGRPLTSWANDIVKLVGGSFKSNQIKSNQKLYQCVKIFSLQVNMGHNKKVYKIEMRCNK